MIFYKLKNYIKDIFRYPKYYSPDEVYEVYWSKRDIHNPVLNSFQKNRADLLLSILKEGDSVLDIGCGNGNILVYVKNKIKLGRVLGVDTSATILEIAKKNGIEVIEKDIRNPRNLDDLNGFDIILFFEVLEHIMDSDAMLGWAMDRSSKGVIFSVPNTGFIMHRLRLLLGRFPLQWRAHPSEHVRFWTLRDMRWWLGELGYKNSKIYTYEGIPILNRIWPSLFSAGLFIFIKK